MKRLIFVACLCFAISPAHSKVMQGIDRLQELFATENLARVAILAHNASRTNQGEHLIEKALDTGLNLQLIFAPEHGLRSNNDDYVGDGIDPHTGLPIVSLYKRAQREPSDEDLKKFDTLVIDLKDVGVRYYTYIGTAYLTAKRAIEARKKVIVLDRVNPLGNTVSGPMLGMDLAGHTISFFRFPLAHGLTIGEVLKFAFRKHPHKYLLNVVENRGWRPDQVWHETGLSWTLPSPALPTYEQTYLYSILGGMECLNISVGRSKSNLEAFKFYGAPWITRSEAETLVSRLNSLGLKGLTFHPVKWNVTRSIHNGKVANGFRVQLEDFKSVTRYESLYKVMQTFVHSFPKKIEYNRWCHRYLGDTIYLNFIKNNVPFESIVDQIHADEYAFERTIHGYRIYK